MAAMVLGGCAVTAPESRTLKFPEGNGVVVYQAGDELHKLYNVQEVTPGDPNWIVKQSDGTTLIPKERIIQASPYHRLPTE
jgi:hypothetical protein